MITLHLPRLTDFTPLLAPYVVEGMRKAMKPTSKHAAGRQPSTRPARELKREQKAKRQMQAKSRNRNRRVH